MKNQSKKYQFKLLTAIILIVVSLSSIPVIASQPQRTTISVTFFFDEDITSQKSSEIFDLLINDTVTVHFTPISGKYDLFQAITNLDSNDIAIYGFHGIEQGLLVNSELISWDQLRQKINQSQNEYHYVLSCYSNNVGALNSKMIVAQEGIVDYLISTLDAACFVAEVTKKPELIIKLKQRISEGENGLKLRYKFPLEPFWNYGTHDFISETAWNWLETKSGFFTIPWIPASWRTAWKSYLRSDIVPSASQHVDEYDDRIDLDNLQSLEDVADIIKNKNDPTIDAQITAGLWHLSADFNINIDIHVPGGSDEVASFELFDEIDGIRDNHIHINFVRDGLAEQKVQELRSEILAPNNGLQIIDISDRLVRSAHYIQDQQNPFHTALPNSDGTVMGDPLEVLDCNYQIDLDPSTINREAEEAWKEIIKENILVAIFGRLTIFPMLVSSFYMREGVELSSAALAMYSLSTNLAEFAELHTLFEEEIENNVYNTAFTQGIENYIDGLSKNTIRDLSNQLSSNPYQTLKGWSQESRNQIETLYDTLYWNPQFTTSVENIGKEQLKSAIVKTIVFHYNYFHLMIDADDDGDGLSNGLEKYVYGTQCKDSDTDNDGMPDGYEVNYGLNPLYNGDAGADPDNDGVNNYNEYVYGTNPVVYSPYVTSITSSYVFKSGSSMYARFYFKIQKSGSYRIKLRWKMAYSYSELSWASWSTKINSVYSYSAGYTRNTNSYLTYAINRHVYQAEFTVYTSIGSVVAQRSYSITIYVSSGGGGGGGGGGGYH